MAAMVVVAGNTAVATPEVGSDSNSGDFVTPLVIPDVTIGNTDSRRHTQSATTMDASHGALTATASMLAATTTNIFSSLSTPVVVGTETGNGSGPVIAIDPPSSRADSSIHMKWREVSQLDKIA